MEISSAPLFFEGPAQFREWLSDHHRDEKELWVGYHKKSSGKKSMTWPESVDEALCFGWIDGIRKSIDEERYTIRFTPRKTTSHWSAVNIKRMNELIQEKRTMEAGLEAFKRRKEDHSHKFAYEQKFIEFPEEYLRKLKSNPSAFDFFEKLPPSVKKPTIWYVISAKREETRLRRLDTVIEYSAKAERIPPLQRNKPKK